MPADVMFCENQLGVPYTTTSATSELPLLRVALTLAFEPVALAALNQPLGRTTE